MDEKRIYKPTDALAIQERIGDARDLLGSIVQDVDIKEINIYKK